jgi:hypothetical protein
MEVSEWCERKEWSAKKIENEESKEEKEFLWSNDVTKQTTRITAQEQNDWQASEHQHQDEERSEQEDKNHNQKKCEQKYTVDKTVYVSRKQKENSWMNTSRESWKSRNQIEWTRNDGCWVTRRFLLR